MRGNANEWKDKNHVEHKDEKMSMYQHNDDDEMKCRQAPKKRKARLCNKPQTDKKKIKW